MNMTKEEYEARIAMYDEATDHLDCCVHENEEELRQSRIVKDEIRKLRDRFDNKYGHRFDPKPH